MEKITLSELNFTLNSTVANFPIKKIISGGQTGVDRAALDVAIALKIPHGGYCPKKRKAEDGIIPLHYHLQETDSSDYTERTQKNVLAADGTLIILQKPPSGGTLLTINTARQCKKPCLIVDLSKEPFIGNIAEWINKHHIQILNVAGPRESQNSGIYRLTYDLLLALLQ